jgi:DNA-binding response OmpR family regulator
MHAVLVLEDERLIALDVHAALTGAGASVDAAADVRDAALLASSETLSAAVLDINLGVLDCWVICRVLARRQVPFLFYTGYSASEVLKEWPEAPILTKPASREQIVGAVSDLIGASAPAAVRSS